MKKLIYQLYVVLLAFVLIPLSCTTEQAAARPQVAPDQQEQSQNVPAMQETQPNPASRNDPPAAGTVYPQTDKPDAVSGATDAVSGATLSRKDMSERRKPQADAEQQLPQQQEQPVAVHTDKAAGSVAQAAAESSAPAAAMEEQSAGEHAEPAKEHAEPVEVLSAAVEQSLEEPSTVSELPVVAEGNLSDQQITADGGKPAEPLESIAASAERADTASEGLVAADAGHSAEQQDSMAEAAEIPDSDAAAVTSEDAGLSTDRLEPIPDAALEPIAGGAAAESGELLENTAAVLNTQNYEDSLADLISEFEQQGGTHGYEPPPTFHEEMLDLFSPQIFTVALSKEPETEQKVKVSRMVAVEEKQRLELTYPGHGWVYVGEQTAQQGLKYEQRKLQDNNSIFMFTADKKGDYVLHFSYFDVFTNDFITDAVAVSVSAARSTAAKSMVRAPDYKIDPNAAETEAQQQTDTAQAAAEPASAVPLQQSAAEQDASRNSMVTAGSEADAAASTDAVVLDGAVLTASTSSGMDGNLNPDELLEKAQTAIGAADAATALQYLDQFFAAATKNLDKGWFLQGRAYELNGSARNIKRALESYKTLTAAYPQSKYWAEADARIRYITGFYINIQ